MPTAINRSEIRPAFQIATTLEARAMLHGPLSSILVIFPRTVVLLREVQNSIVDREHNNSLIRRDSGQCCQRKNPSSPRFICGPKEQESEEGVRKSQRTAGTLKVFAAFLDGELELLGHVVGRLRRQDDWNDPC